jgi:hypothetical protein
MDRDKIRERLEKRLSRTKPSTGHHRVLTRRLEKLKDAGSLSEKVEPISEKAEAKAETKAPARKKVTRKSD